MVVMFRDYEEGDVYRLDIREGDTIGVILQDFPTPGWTMFSETDILACGGIVQAGGGVGNVWAYISDKARGHGVSLLRFSRSAMDRALSIMLFHRLQTVVRTDRPEYERFVELLGFEKEGRLRKATSTQEDLFLYARTI